MNWDNATELKELFKREFVKEHLPSRAAARVEALEGSSPVQANTVALNPDMRLSVGVSKVGKKRDFKMELRVQREGGLAHRAAETFKSRAHGEANIEIIPRLEAPSVSLVQSEDRSDPAGTQPAEPLCIGVSVSHSDGPTGTLGAFVETKDGDAILSNCHVLSPASNELEGFVFHPGRKDVPRLTRSLRIATIKDATQFQKTDTNDTDGAIAVLLNNKFPHDGNRIPPGSKHRHAGKRLKAVIGMMDLVGEQRVSKIGRTTGSTEGIISAIAIDNVPVDIPGFGILSFSNVIEIRSLSPDEPFTLPGDSGSVVFTEDGLGPFGLHFAGEYKGKESSKLKVSYACDLATVLETFKARWIL